MKGIIFSELMLLVEDIWGLEKVDEIIEMTSPESNGAYTSLGDYQYNEFLNYLDALEQTTTFSKKEILHAFGIHLFGRVTRSFPEIFMKVDNLFELLSDIEGFVYAEIYKVYPDVALPSLRYREVSQDKVVMSFQSEVVVPALISGLLEACASKYELQINVDFSLSSGVLNDSHIQTFVMSEVK